MRKPIAVACSDVHLSDKAPRARAGEPDWHLKMEEALKLLTDVSLDLDVPLIIAGDVFHKPRESPAVEILAMKWLSRTRVIMVPGQHDLPNHSIENIGKSSYGVLEAHLREVSHNYNPKSDKLNVSYFPFDAEKKNAKKSPYPGIAVVHDMVWKGEEPYPGAPEEGNVKNFIKKLKGYEFIICGDNHSPFVYETEETTVINCGSLMRRTADQEDHKPRAYVLFDDGSYDAVFLPVEDDVFSREHCDISRAKDERIEAYVNNLKEIEMDLSFESNLKRFCEVNKVEDKVVELLKEAVNV